MPAQICLLVPTGGLSLDGGFDGAIAAGWVPSCFSSGAKSAQWVLQTQSLNCVRGEIFFLNNSHKCHETEHSWELSF